MKIQYYLTNTSTPLINILNVESILTDLRRYGEISLEFQIVRHLPFEDPKQWVT